MLFKSTDQGQIGGSGVPVPPAGSTGLGPLGQGAPIGIVQLNSKGTDQQDPRMLTASIQAETTNTATGAGGPLVGIAEFASGNGVSQTVEFDIPLSSRVARSGLLVSFPASACRILCRNDANVIPSAGGSPLGTSLVPPTVTASLAVGSRPTSPIWRTLFAIHALAGSGLAAAGTTAILIPAFAKRFRVLRGDVFGAGQPIAILVLGQNILIPIDGPYAVAANVPAPFLELPPGATTILVQNTGAAEILSVAAIFEIGL